MDSGKRETMLDYLWLFVGGILLIFSNGRWIIQAATWIAPVFIVHFYRKRRGLRGIVPVVMIFFMTIGFISFNGVVPEGGVIQYLILLGLGLAFSTPFIIDNYFYPRIDSFKATLVLPLAGVTFEYLSSLINPYATWGSIAYTQYGNLSLMQLASITGIWGISFILYWFYSVASWAWERNFNFSRIKKNLYTYFIILLLLLLVGGGVLVLFPPDSDSVRIASISVPQNVWDVLNPIQLGQEVSSEYRKEVEIKLEKLHGKLLELTTREAENGSKIIFWHEANGIVLKENEDEFIDKASKIAKEKNIYILMALYTITPGQRLGGNKAVMIDPAGEKVFIYIKSEPVPGEWSKKGEGNIEYLDTPYGRIGTAICYDMDFPGLIIQAGKKDIDIMFVPSADWKEIDPMHTRMAVFRAVENGFNMVRQVMGAHSIAVDYRGQTRSLLDYYNTAEKVMISYIPTKGIKTIYSLLGDWFAWLCIAAFTILSGRYIIKK